MIVTAHKFYYYHYMTNLTYKPKIFKSYVSIKYYKVRLIAKNYKIMLVTKGYTELDVLTIFLFIWHYHLIIVDRGKILSID